MQNEARIEIALEKAIDRAAARPCPARLAEAIRYAVFPGGGRVRPGLCLTVACALGDPDPALADAAAVAVELLHCASLVQDDLPCFDDAPVRRGQPSLHQRFGQAIAILVGDALIVSAFEAVSTHVAASPAKSSAILQALVRAAGAPSGIAAGQAWESERNIDLGAYHHAKTAALFEAAAVSGAIAAGVNGELWRRTGGCLGEAYQMADDLADTFGEAHSLGKNIGRDDDKARPNAVVNLGVEAARDKLATLIEDALRAIPDCPGRAEVEALLRRTGARLCPPGLRGEDAQRRRGGAL
jgi:geranylgeranyl diphosphate synthase type II